ncbi:MAG TPA: hypothetical protein VJS44_09450, partial [Pyrinomonadaceae bacterium]|nr:hypothetical protein [Pyrinomonadaceae bacterium]
MDRVNFRRALYLAAVAALLLMASAPYNLSARVMGQDMQGMPGMDMSKPKASPTPTPQQKQPDMDEKKKEMEDMPGMNMGTSTTPAKPVPQPAASPATPQPTPDSPVAQPKSSTGHEGHDMGNMSMPGETKEQGTEMKGSMPGMNMKGMSGMGRMDADSLVIMNGEGMDIRVGRSSRNSFAMGQMGSGSSWQPATTPMYMWYKAAGQWLIFFHSDLKLGVNAQGGPRGVTKLESQNWFMPMAFRRVGAGTLQLRGMFSLEPFTFSGQGSPQLFQTGETFQGRPIRDAQHPHDLFMELSATYTLPLGERGTWFAYLGFPGEPALGPTAFMHRWSASENPSAPLTHHLQDSTHISFGVFTTGFTYRWLKVEGSVFNGREPGENRYNFEFNPWNSRSFRVSVVPNQNWAMQWSYGLLKNPEALEPGDVRRMTASVSYNKRFSRGNWATSLIWGRNREEHHGDLFTLNGYTAESTVQFLDKNYLYTRLELVDKTGLLDATERAKLGITSSHPLFRIGAYTVGYSRDVWTTEKLNVALGSDVTFYSKPAVLD